MCTVVVLDGICLVCVGVVKNNACAIAVLGELNFRQKVLLVG